MGDAELPDTDAPGQAAPAFDVPGFLVEALLGFGAGGEVWRARQPSGDLVVLRRLAGADKALIATIRAAAAVVRKLPSSHLIRLRTVTLAGDEEVLVLDHAAAGSLEALLARRGRVEPGEVVTAVAPLADALGQAHRHGLVHGRIRASSVLLTAEGKPLLEGLGLTCLYDVAGVTDAASDVRDLGALAYLMLSGEAPGAGPLAGAVPTAPLPLVRAIESALAPDPVARLSAADLAVSLLAACPALPLRGLGEVVTICPPTVGSGGLRRRLVVGAGAAFVLLLVVAGGWAWGRQSAAGPVQVSAVTPTDRTATPPDWAQLLRQLDQLRAQAFARADPAVLARVYLEGSALLVADREAVAALARHRRSAVGVAHEVRSVAPLLVGRDRVELLVSESLTAYVIRGAATARRPAGPLVEHLVVLVRTAAGWRVGEVRLGRPGSGLLEAGQQR